MLGEIKTRNAFGASNRASAQIGIDWAKRMVKRSNQGLPVSREELRVAKRIVAALAAGQLEGHRA